MANNNDGLDCFDDKQALDYILSHLPAQYAGKVNAQQAQYIIDCEVDFYASKGVFDDDSNDEPDLDFDVEEELAFINQMIADDNRTAELPADLVKAVWEANEAYVEKYY